MTGDSLLWREGQPQWISAEHLLPELFPAESDFYDEPTKVRSDSDSTIGYPEPKPKSHSLVAGDVAANDTITTSAAALLKAQRRQRKKRNQWIIIAVLVIVSVVLLAGLILVLMKGQAPSIPAN